MDTFDLQSTSTRLALLVGAPGAFLLLRHVVAILKAYRKLGNGPGRKLIMFSPVSAIGLFAAAPRGSTGDPRAYYGPYARVGSSVIASVPVLEPTPFPVFWFADPEGIKKIAGDRYTFPKDVKVYEIIQFYGQNVITAEGEDWRRHREVCKAAFGGNADLVYAVASAILRDWFKDVDTRLQTSEDGFLEVDIVAIMTMITLHVISAAGFGRKLSWTDKTWVDSPPSGYKMTFKEALCTAIDSIMIKAVAPEWAYRLPFDIPVLSDALAKSKLSYDELKVYMKEMMLGARKEVQDGAFEEEEGRPRHAKEADLLRRLTQASEVNGGEKLSDDEVISNIYVFLLAGHASSAHSISFTIALLSLHPEEQEKIYAEVSKVFPNGWPADDFESYKNDYQRLEYTLATVRESLRLFPTVPRIPKLVGEDSLLPATDDKGNRTEVFVPKGSTVIMDLISLGSNPMYWGADAAAFKPERFIDQPDRRWPREAYYPFSAGARACLGQKFATTEIVCVIANMVRRYEIHLPKDFEGMEREDQMKRLLNWKTGVTATPLDIRARLKRRAV